MKSGSVKNFGKFDARRRFSNHQWVHASKSKRGVTDQQTEKHLLLTEVYPKHQNNRDCWLLTIMQFLRFPNRDTYPFLPIEQQFAKKS